jgi:heme/copper-type cytochrome/quinol oxidase subunit 2
MAEFDFAAFGMWSVITAVVIVITSVVYRSYRRKQNETSTS